MLEHSRYNIQKVATNVTQPVHLINFRPVTLQSAVDGPTVINMERFHCDPSSGYFPGESKIFDESIPSLLQAPTRLVTTQDVTEIPPHVFVSF